MVILGTLASTITLLFNGGIMNNSVIAWSVPEDMGNHYLPDLSFAGAMIVTAAVTLAGVVFVAMERKEPVHKSLLT
jgi:hypothetical protein